MIKLYTDASTKGKNGPSGVGIVIMKDGQQIQISRPLIHNYTNHEAEFLALIIALDYILTKTWQEEFIFAFSDSKIVVDSIHKNYVKQESYQKYYRTLATLIQKCSFFEISWLSEQENKGADHLARQALQKALKEKNVVESRKKVEKEKREKKSR